MLEGMTWDPDILDGFESLEIPLPEAARAPGESDEIEIVATLVRRVGLPDKGVRAIAELIQRQARHLDAHWSRRGIRPGHMVRVFEVRRCDV